MHRFIPGLLALMFTAASTFAQQKTVTIAVVNNPDMIRLKKLANKFEEKNPDIKLNWVILEENILRQRVTTDVSQRSGQFDLVYLGLYETPIFAKRGWLRPWRTSRRNMTSKTSLKGFGTDSPMRASCTLFRSMVKARC